MCSSIREFGFKIPALARTDGEVVDGHLRLKAARKLGITELPVILCEEWTPAQVKAFRLMLKCSVTWADWDEEFLALELQDIQSADFDLSLTGFDPGEIDGLLALEDDERANTTPPLASNSMNESTLSSGSVAAAVNGAVSRSQYGTTTQQGIDANALETRMTAVLRSLERNLQYRNRLTRTTFTSSGQPARS